jgi:chromate reductase, NAD(P)H dehydrogenase (quinone)
MPHNSPSLLVFAGSTRQHSFNRKLARAAADIARDAGAAVTLLELSDFDIPLYNADLEAQGTPADVVRLKEVLWQHPAWVICSPEYNGSYTALLKNTIDWASSPVKGHPDWQDGTKAFRGKVVGMLSASPGALGGLRSQSHLAPLLINLECWLAPKAFALGSAGSAFDESGALVQPAHRDRVRAVVDQVLWASSRLHGDAAAGQ